MAQLSLTLPDTLFHRLEQLAQRAGQSPDEFILRSLEQTVQETPDDPLLRLLGSLEADMSNLGKQHDAYLTSAGVW